MNNNICELDENNKKIDEILKNKDIKEIIFKDFFSNANRTILSNLKISYIARRKSDNATIILLGNDKLEDLKNNNNYYNLIDFNKVSNFIDFHNESVFKYNYLRDFISLTKNINLPNFLNKIINEKVKLPCEFIQKLFYSPIILSNNQKIIDYNNYYDFRFFVNEIQPIIKQKIDNLSFYDLAYLLGCFSPMEIQDFNTKSKIYLGQKATSLLSRFIKTNQFYNPIYSTIKWNDLEVKPNKEFLDFISVIDKNKYSNFEMLANLDSQNEDYYDQYAISIFELTIKNFDKIKSMRKSINEKGIPYNKPWKDCIIDSILPIKYKNINPKNKDMAKIFLEKGIDQNKFNIALSLRKKALKNNMPNNILNIPLKEKNIIEEIKILKDENITALKEGKTQLSINLNKQIKNTYEKQFTYELLDKYDPINAIIGTYCSCCAIIDNLYYGSKIVEATMTKSDIQNIVIKDKNGEIVAKGAMYINAEKEYGLINDFEISDKFKKFQRVAGYYDIQSKNDTYEQSREKIFEAFIRAVTDFVKEYDIEHPDKPLKQVNVGMGYNRLKEQCKKLEPSHYLSAPKEYEFEDTKDGQVVIYKTPEKKEKSCQDKVK
jgi:hypothetical protein